MNVLSSCIYDIQTFHIKLVHFNDPLESIIKPQSLLLALSIIDEK